MQQPILASHSLNTAPRLVVGVDELIETSLDDADAFAGLFDASEAAPEEAEIAEPTPTSVEEEDDLLTKLATAENTDQKEPPRVEPIVDPEAAVVGETAPKVDRSLESHRHPVRTTAFADSDAVDSRLRETAPMQSMPPGDIPTIYANTVRDLPTQLPTKNREAVQSKQPAPTVSQPRPLLHPAPKSPEPDVERMQPDETPKPQVSVGSRDLAPTREITFNNSVDSRLDQIPSRPIAAKVGEVLEQISAEKEHSPFAISTSVSIDQPTTARGLTMSPQSPVATPQITQQVVAAIAQSSGGSIEITLNPEELGRVRVQLTPSDNGTLVILQSERPDVLDALRRHIDLLAQDLGDAGFENLEFDFSGFDKDDSNEPQDADDPIDDLTQAPETTTTYKMNVSDSGLDLRL